MSKQAEHAAWKAMTEKTEAVLDQIREEAQQAAAVFPNNACTFRMVMEVVGEERRMVFDIMQQLSARVHALEEQATNPRRPQ